MKLAPIAGEVAVAKIVRDNENEVRVFGTRGVRPAKSEGANES